MPTAAEAADSTAECTLLPTSAAFCGGGCRAACHAGTDGHLRRTGVPEPANAPPSRIFRRLRGVFVAHGTVDCGDRGSATNLASNGACTAGGDRGLAVEVPSVGRHRGALRWACHPGPLGGNAAHARLQEEERQHVRQHRAEKGG